MRAWARAWVGALVGLGLALGVAATSGAASGKRVALVIGNSHYTRVRELGSPVEDARKWAVALKGAGFDVDQCLDCKLEAMRGKLDAFYKRVAEGDEAFFYYSGHGAEQGDFNYLFPVDADVHGCGTLAEQGISLSYVLDVMDKARVKVVVLDACRTSPFATCTKAIDGSLFGPPKMMPGGTLIAYATTRGDPARDDGQGSAFSKALLPQAFEPGKPLYQALSEAAALVQGATGIAQTPTTYTSMAGVPYVLVPTISRAEKADAAWQGIAVMVDGTAKTKAVVGFLSQYGSTGASSVAAAQDYLTTGVRGAVPLGKVGDPPVGGPTGRTYVARKGTAGEMTFIGLSEGVFDMGSPEGGDDSGEHSQHRVRVSAFAIGQSEVTQAQWTAVVTAAQKAKDKDAKGLKMDPSSTKGAQRPVEGVSWCDAARFANALSRLEGKRPVYTVGTDCKAGGSVPWDHAANGYRLPTEAEWEYAARAGTTGAYSFGDNPDQLCGYANVFDQAGKKAHSDWTRASADCDDRASETASVCSYQKNPWGLCDVHGNVWEWSWDVYDDGYYGRSPATDPAGSADRGDLRVLRGGSWVNAAGSARSANRVRFSPSNMSVNIGFRLVLPVAVSEP